MNELVVDFQAAPTDTELITMKDQSVEAVSTYKYVGSVIDNKLSWMSHTVLQEGTKENVGLLQKLQFFKVDQAIMQLFYHAVIQNVRSVSLISFFSNANTEDTGRLEKITRIAGRSSEPTPSVQTSSTQLLQGCHWTFAKITENLRVHAVSRK